MTIAADSSTFVDTNILVYANLARSPFHAAATERLNILDQQGVELWISRQVLREHLASMTRQSDLTGVIPITSLIADVRYFEMRFRIVEDGPHVTEQLLAILEQVDVGHRRVHDANIVATMQVYGIRNLLTHNTADFVRYAHLITVWPLVETN